MKQFTLISSEKIKYINRHTSVISYTPAPIISYEKNGTLKSEDRIKPVRLEEIKFKSLLDTLDWKEWNLDEKLYTEIKEKIMSDPYDYPPREILSWVWYAYSKGDTVFAEEVCSYAETSNLTLEDINDFCQIQPGLEDLKADLIKFILSVIMSIRK
ncbi:MAG: hypothetical protein K2N05_04865 [Muribaculaceae bacterium]|nr:hypothetical protein [Muribaculaceae bacterium]